MISTKEPEPEKLLRRRDLWVDDNPKVISMELYRVWKSQAVWRVIIGEREFERMCREWNE